MIQDVKGKIFLKELNEILEAHEKMKKNGILSVQVNLLEPGVRYEVHCNHDLFNQLKKGQLIRTDVDWSDEYMELSFIEGEFKFFMLYPKEKCEEDPDCEYDGGGRS